jgi:hypothetical protein
MSIPEPKWFNGAPGEVTGDGYGNGARTQRIKYECADCHKLFVNGISAYDHGLAHAHKLLHWPSKTQATFPENRKSA